MLSRKDFEDNGLASLLLHHFNGSWREETGGVAFGQLEEMWLRFDLAKLQRPDLGNRAEKRIINILLKRFVRV